MHLPHGMPSVGLAVRSVRCGAVFDHALHCESIRPLLSVQLCRRRTIWRKRAKSIAPLTTNVRLGERPILCRSLRCEALRRSFPRRAAAAARQTACRCCWTALAVVCHTADSRPSWKTIRTCTTATPRRPLCSSLVRCSPSFSRYLKALNVHDTSCVHSLLDRVLVEQSTGERITRRFSFAG